MLFKNSQIDLFNEDYYTKARDNMIINQLVPNGVNKAKILTTLKKIPKHHFIQSKWKQFSYVDTSIPIINNKKPDSKPRFMLSSFIFAKMLQDADIDNQSIVLDVGCATGYSSVVISKFAKKVFGIDNNAFFLKACNSYLETMKRTANLEFLSMDTLFKGGIKQKFDVIVINGIVNNSLEKFSSYLKSEGKIVVIERQDHHSQIVKYTKNNNHIHKETLSTVDADDRLILPL
ncbi:MAG: protein-L-isoaspartate(D-aspartate) O-methyltransferase [Candidatus Midichloriaceae bacterium]|jgi:protein-L-isoaspartate(D-aspartate) O-methyltransferase